MYDVEKLVSIVCEFLDIEESNKKYNAEVRKDKGYLPDAWLWIPSLKGNEAYGLGVYSGRSAQIEYDLCTVCDMLGIDKKRLVSAVKSMLRKERHNGRWDNPNLTCWISYKDKERLCRFLSN